MVNLRALEAAIQQVEQISEQELSFKAGDTSITLRNLRPMEETAVQKWASTAWESADPDGDNPAFAEYLDRLRYGMLGYSIIEIAGQDLRSVEFVATDEVDDNGKTVEIPKDEVVRDFMVKNWSRAMLTEVYAQYRALQDKVEAKASQAVEYEASDLADEIERLENRLKDLREKQLKQEEKQKDQITTQHEALGGINEAQRKARAPRPTSDDLEEAQQEAPHEEAQQEAPQRQRAQQEAPHQASEEPPQGRRQSAVPEGAPPPMRDEEAEYAQEGQHEQHEQHEPEDPNRIPAPHGGDSFFDPSDPDSEDAVAAESHRQAVLLRQNAERQAEREKLAQQRREAGLPDGPARPPQTNPGAPQNAARVDRRVSGLRSAANASDVVHKSRPEQITTARPDRPTPAQIGGKPVYKMPTQTLDRPQRPRDGDGRPTQVAPTAADGVSLNPEGGSRNPRFRGPEER